MHYFQDGYIPSEDLFTGVAAPLPSYHDSIDGQIKGTDQRGQASLNAPSPSFDGSRSWAFAGSCPFSRRGRLTWDFLAGLVVSAAGRCRRGVGILQGVEFLLEDRAFVFNPLMHFVKKAC